MRTRTHLGRRVMALAAAGALTASLGAAVIAAQPAQAAIPEGTVAITPASGDQDTGLTATLSAPCPDGSQSMVGYLDGAGSTPANGALQSNRSVSQSFQIDSTFKLFFQAQGIASPTGTYTVRIVCLADDAFTQTAKYTQSVVFTPTGGGVGNSTYVAQPAAAPATTTTLSAPDPLDPVKAGDAVSLTATVASGGGTPAGTVQFKAGATNLGAPVALTVGTATLPASTAIPAGTNSLTAVYIPGANAFQASTSAAVSYVVAGPATITGTAVVGSNLTCASTTGGTPTYVWNKAGVATAITTQVATVPADWAGVAITCAVTTTKNAKSVTQTSGQVVPTAAPVTVGTTTVVTSTPDLVALGGSVVLTATVTEASGPNKPTGTVQFKAGASNLGSSVAVNNGVAMLSTTALPIGNAQVTAVYTPTGLFTTSTSAAASIFVVGPTTRTGTLRVGNKVTCTAVSPGPKTYAWFRGGKNTGATTATVTVPASWANQAIACAVTTSKGTAKLARYSTSSRGLLGLAPVATKKPAVTGTAKVGKVLTCARGTWTSAPTAYRFQWLRGGSAISGKTGATYKAVKADKGKKVSCRVVALKSGYTPGVATSAARKVK